MLLHSSYTLWGIGIAQSSELVKDFRNPRDNDPPSLGELLNRFWEKSRDFTHDLELPIIGSIDNAGYCLSYQKTDRQQADHATEASTID